MRQYASAPYPSGSQHPSVQDVLADIEERATHAPECCSRLAGMQDACDCWKATR